MCLVCGTCIPTRQQTLRGQGSVCSVPDHIRHPAGSPSLLRPTPVDLHAAVIRAQRDSEYTLHSFPCGDSLQNNRPNSQTACRHGPDTEHPDPSGLPGPSPSLPGPPPDLTQPPLVCLRLGTPVIPRMVCRWNHFRACNLWEMPLPRIRFPGIRPGCRYVCPSLPPRSVSW